jgi:hypothetical protein
VILPVSQKALWKSSHVDIDPTHSHQDWKLSLFDYGCWQTIALLSDRFRIGLHLPPPLPQFTTIPVVVASWLARAHRRE